MQGSEGGRNGRQPHEDEQRAHTAVRADTRSTASAAAVARRVGKGTAGTDVVRLRAADRGDHGHLVVDAPRQAPANRGRPGMGRPHVTLGQEAYLQLLQAGGSALPNH